MTGSPYNTNGPFIGITDNFEQKGDFMKKAMLALIIIILSSVSLSGCGDADMEGIVLTTTENYVQVATELSTDDFEEIKDKPAGQIQDEDVLGDTYRGLINLTYDNPEKFSKGDEVDIWIDGDIRESYPSGATAKKISLKK